MARNTNRQGANFELDVMHYLTGCNCESTFTRPRHVGWKGFGYDTSRSSGSLGKIDVFGAGPLRTYEDGAEPDAERVVIQCKTTDPVISPAERVALIAIALRYGALPVVAHRARDGVTGRTRPHFRILTGPGPKEWEPWAPGEDI